MGRPIAWLVVGALVTSAGCHCGPPEPFRVDVTVDRAGLPVPDRLDLEVAELDEPGGATLSGRAESFNGADFFANEGSSNHFIDSPSDAAGAVRIRATAYVATGAEAGSGVVEVPRSEGLVSATLTLTSGPLPDAATDAGTDAGYDGAGPGCGDGIAQPGERCDSADLGGQDCTTIGQGWVSGVLGCSAACEFDVSACVPPAGCGDGVIAGAEQCDGASLGGATCASLGFDAGVLACAGGCIFDTSGCSTCGDTVIGGSEQCDGTDLGGETCTSLGYTGGILACSALCVYDVSSCAGAPPVPLLRKPINGTYMGSIFVPGSRRPTFVWEPVLGSGVTYDLQYSTDSSFATGVTTATTSSTSSQPATDLPVSMAVPVGARYFWRVRACDGATCSVYSSAWYVGIGRSDRDFNGDGYADVAIGAYGTDGIGTDTGAAYVYFGGAGGALDTTPDGTLAGVAVGDALGASVAVAGDVNADGFGDLIVGAWGADLGGTDSGAAYLYLGAAGASFDASADAVLLGAGSGDGFGTHVAGAGDVNGDGYADVVVGAPYSDLPYADAGRAYLYYGGAGAFSTVAVAILSGEAPADNYGDQVASGGDLNGDGCADLVIVASHNDLGGTDAGKVYVYLGGSGSLDTTPDATFLGTSSARLEYGAGSAGDVNDDGFDDLLLGSNYDDASSTDAGRAWVYLGGPGTVLDTMADTTIDGPVAGTGLGYSVAGAGDLNADGYADIVVGATASSVGGPYSGAAYVYFGGPSGVDAIADAELVGGGASEAFGRSVSGAGDVNGDGYGDLIAGGDGGGGAGVARFYLGGPGATFDPTPDATLFGTMAGQLFGFSVAFYLQPLAPRGAGLHPRG
jgi:hypothetical protein